MSKRAFVDPAEVMMRLLDGVSDSFCYPLATENIVAGYIANGYYVQAKNALNQFFDFIAPCSEAEKKLSLIGLMIRIMKLAYELPDSSPQNKLEIVNGVILVFGDDVGIEQIKATVTALVNILCTMHEPLANHLPALVVKTKRIVDRYYDNPNFNISMVGEKLGVSGYYASKIFKRFMGIQLSDYICRVRVERAKRFMLDKRLSFDAIALRVGLNDARALNTVFKRVEGMSPSAYRTFVE